MRDNRVRLSATRLLEVIMRQGLVNPNEAVPHLFALQGDLENDEIRSLACEMLTAESERRPETVSLTNLSCVCQKNQRLTQTICSSNCVLPRA